MPEGPGEWVEKDAFVLPVIPDELRVDPQLAALLHAAAFLELSGDEAVDPDWAVEALEHIAHYLLKLPAPEVERTEDQLKRIAEFGRNNGWTDEAAEFIETFLQACGVTEEEE